MVTVVNTTTKKLASLEVNDDGELKVTGAGGGSGDASAANQVTGNASLASIDGKTPALGQALAAASSPVVLTAAQITTLTPPAAITGFATAANQTAANTKFDTLITQTDGVEASLTAIDANAGTTTDAIVAGGAAGTESAKLRRLTSDIAAMLALATNSGYRAQVTVTRPANTTAYTAGDVLGGVITFPTIGASGGHAMVTTLDLRVDIAAIPTGMTGFRLHLYSVTPPSALADNAAWDLPSGDRSGYIGFIDLSIPIDFGSTLFVQADQINKHLKLAAADTSLYGYLVTNGGFTPAANSEVYVPTLRTVGL